MEAVLGEIEKMKTDIVQLKNEAGATLSYEHWWNTYPEQFCLIPLTLRGHSKQKRNSAGLWAWCGCPRAPKYTVTSVLEPAAPLPWHWAQTHSHEKFKFNANHFCEHIDDSRLIVSHNSPIRSISCFSILIRCHLCKSWPSNHSISVSESNFWRVLLPHSLKWGDVGIMIGHWLVDSQETPCTIATFLCWLTLRPGFHGGRWRTRPSGCFLSWGRAFLVVGAVFGPCPCDTCAGAVCSPRQDCDVFFAGKRAAACLQVVLIDEELEWLQSCVQVNALPLPRLSRKASAKIASPVCVRASCCIAIYFQGRRNPRKAQVPPMALRARLCCFAFRAGPALVAHAFGCHPCSQ